MGLSALDNIRVEFYENLS